MKLRQNFFAVIIVASFAAGVFTAAAQPSNAVTSAPVFVPDYSHANEPLPDGVIAWDALLKSTTATNGQDFAQFTFSFTNITPGNVTIIDVHPGCGCTTVDLPPRPWTIAAGATGQMNISVNLAGKTSTSGVLPKYVNVSTDKGSKQLNLVIKVLPAPPMTMSEEDRAKGVAAAKIDRQAVFKGDCASCHVKNIDGQFGDKLFAATCAICHEANPRATMVPDLHNLKDPTSEEFWRTWITAGKAGTLMPAFATSQGGPLTDLQIASLAAYLNAIIPPHAPLPTAPPLPAK
jgi:mono/diheme cytochrome c family protein